MYPYVNATQWRLLETLRDTRGDPAHPPHSAPIGGDSGSSLMQWVLIAGRTGLEPGEPDDNPSE